MTSAEHVKDILSFLNECDIYKLIMKPCASFADFIEPVNAALEYRRLKKQAESDLEQANMNIFFSEEDFQRMEESRQENIRLYEQAADVVMTMLKQHFTIEEMGSMGEYVVEHYLRDLLDYYLETMVHGNGNYLVGYNQLKNEFHHEDIGQSFQMMKKEGCEIPPEIFRQILFLLMTLTKACRQILGKYAVSVTIETASEKFFVVRFSCDYSNSLDKNGKNVLPYHMKDSRTQGVIVFSHNYLSKVSIFNFLQHLPISSTNSLSVKTVTRPSSYCLSTHTFTILTSSEFLSTPFSFGR